MAQGYNGNPLLKPAGVIMNFTPAQVDEFVRCGDDPYYFIETYVKLVNVDLGLVNFILRPYQRKLIQSFEQNRFTIAKLPRQAGKSVSVVSYFLWMILFQDNQNLAILANKGQLARDLLAKIKMAYEYIPLWLQQGIVTWNKGSIELENGSKILAASTSSSAVRGGSYNAIFLDEFAFVAQNIAEDFFASVYPTISSGQTTKMFIVSTPNGLNHFYKMWTDAVNKKSLYNPIEISWRDVPGRDEKWREETIRNTSQQQFEAEHECEFLGSSHTLISAMKLRSMPAIAAPIRTSSSVDVFERPANNHVYVIAADVSHGAGLDYSAFNVIDITALPWKLAAKFRDNTVLPSSYPDILARTGKWYNDAYILCENNDIGAVVLQSLQIDLEYENLLVTNQTAKGQKLSSGFTAANKTKLGVKTTTAVKRIGCQALKDLIEQDQLLLTDPDIILELSAFVRHNQTFQAEVGQTDDLVMGLVLFGWLTTQAYFKELANMNIRAQMAKTAMDRFADDMPIRELVTDGQTEDKEELDTFGKQLGGYTDYKVVTYW